MNLYVYAGKDLYRQEKALEKLLEKFQIDQDRRVVVDASDRRTFRMEKVLMECDTLSLFDEGKKAVIVRNPFFLNSEISEGGKVTKSDSPAVRKRKENEQATKENRLKLLESYLKNPSEDTVLIFQCHGYNADPRKSDYRLLEKYGCEMVLFDTMDEQAFIPYARKALKDAGYQLEEKAFTAAAGGGAVEVTVSGKREVTKVKLQEDVVDPDDIEMLEDLIVAATNEALRKVEEESSAVMSKLTGGLGGGFPF